ncbi:MAG TPA: PAS domain-containing protein [Stellaceae bacterium]
MTAFPVDGFRGARDIAAPRSPILVRLFEYWDGKRAGRLMPSRADIDPAELRALVLHVMIYGVVEPGRLYRIRLVGQAIVDFVGANHTGKMAGESMPPDAARRMVEILNSVVTRRAPRFRLGSAYWHHDKTHRPFEACFLPLSSDGEAVDKILAGSTFTADR